LHQDDITSMSDMIYWYILQVNVIG